MRLGRRGPMVDETYHPHEACFTTGQFSKSSVTEEEASLITHNDQHCGRCWRARQDTGRIFVWVRCVCSLNLLNVYSMTLPPHHLRSLFMPLAPSEFSESFKGVFLPKGPHSVTFVLLRHRCVCRGEQPFLVSAREADDQRGL
ncbi:hypothetical protein GH733_018429 [Mirounga leonina]|nr:hypothetical protein GH733_018429 [Mirounga leonina]